MSTQESDRGVRRVFDARYESLSYLHGKVFKALSSELWISNGKHHYDHSGKWYTKVLSQDRTGRMKSQLGRFMAVEVFDNFRLLLYARNRCVSLDPFVWPNRECRVLPPLSTSFILLKRDDPSDTSLRRRTPFFFP